MKYWLKPFVLCWLFLCVVIILSQETALLFAQQPDGTGTGGATPGAAAAAPGTVDRGGVLVDANGVLKRASTRDVGTLTTRQLNLTKRAYSLSADISAKSPMRCISLNRMEKAIIAADGNITDEMLYLAGIQRITHVFYFPESKDIVITGPAEGWFPGYEGTMIGRESLQPVCELQDLVVALRAYPPGKEGAGIVGCAIDPTQEGNVQLQQFVLRSRLLDRQAFVQGVRQSLGMQTISVDGVPATTHAAQIMVAADYRMKRIGLGMDSIPPRIGLKTFINNTVPNDSNALFRWYFIPDYDSVILTEDRTGMQLVGEGVKLVGENEVVSAKGERTVVDGTLDPGSAAFTQSFTRQYPQIAKQALVFAQLRNWIDMLICAAHIQQEDFYSKSGWSMEFFGSEEKYRLETFIAPKEVEPVVGQRAVSRTMVLTPVGGGVVIEAEQALDKEHAQADKDGKVTEKQKALALHLPEGVWWWDAK
jgi:hypothetical protein